MQESAERGAERERMDAAPKSNPIRRRKASLHADPAPISERSWLAALLSLLGYADGVTSTDNVRYAWGRLDDEQAIAAARGHSRTVERDVGYLGFGGRSDVDPPRLVLANFTRRGVTVCADCELWAIPRYGEVEILTPSHRFRLDDDCRLERRPNRLDEMRARRVAMALGQWRTLASAKERMGPSELQSAY